MSPELLSSVNITMGVLIFIEDICLCALQWDPAVIGRERFLVHICLFSSLLSIWVSDCCHPNLKTQISLRAAHIIFLLKIFFLSTVHPSHSFLSLTLFNSPHPLLSHPDPLLLHFLFRKVQVSRKWQSDRTKQDSMTWWKLSYRGWKKQPNRRKRVPSGENLNGKFPLGPSPWNSRDTMEEEEKRL